MGKNFGEEGRWRIVGEGEEELRERPEELGE
jgi:hypothetical protein